MFDTQSIEERLKMDAIHSLLFLAMFVGTMTGALVWHQEVLFACALISVMGLYVTLSAGSVRRDLIQVRNELRGTDDS